jgi:pullulanase
MYKLGAAFYMMAQGIPFLHAGEEMLRSKPDGKGGFVENSFKSSDKVNSIKWDLLDKAEYQSCYRYYQGLIAFRKAHPVLRLTSAYEILSHVVPVHTERSHVSVFHVNGDFPGETAKDLLLIFSASEKEETFTLPEGKWNLCIDGETAGTETIRVVENKLTVPRICAMVLVKE